MTCPDDDALAALLGDTAGADERRALLAHLDACESCRMLVADAVAAEPDPAPGGADLLGRGDVIGRYVIDRVLGTGAMGVVYAAHDPQLARDVALKVLRPELADRDALLREARTVARLAHPNVIAIHDAQHDGDRLFIAMELVEGATLGRWLAATPRRWPELRDVMLQVGRGLAAAHAAGIVHRDIKPDNILVARDGRARVTDFGLARLPTEAGVLAGTPAYMSPEQRAGRPLDARSDIYSYCVVLHEALHGARPGADESIPAPARRDVPAHARRAIERGLARDPAQRPAGMDELLAALAPRHRPRIVAAAALAAVAVTAGLGIGLARTKPAAPEPCTGGAAAWGEVWSRDRAGVRAAFGASGLASAGAAFERADAGMARYRGAWIGTLREVCLASTRGEQSSGLLDRRMACLENRRHEAAALVTIFATPDRAVADRAGALIDRLPPPDDCRSAAIAELAPRPTVPADRAALAQIESRIAEARAQQETEHAAACLALVTPVLDQARRLGYPPALAQLLFLRARCEPQDARIVEDLHAAAAAAAAGRDDETLARAWTRLVYIEGFVHHRFDESARWQRYARAVIDRLGAPPRLELELLEETSLSLLAEQRADEARALTERRRQLVLATAGPESPALAELEETLGNTFLDAWRFAEAQEHYRRAEEALARHPRGELARLWLLQNESVALRGTGRPRDALALFPQIFALVATRDPAGDDSWARALYGDALRDAGDPARALAEHRRAEQTCARFSGDHAWQCAPAWDGEGRDLIAAGRPDDAVAPLEHALALYGTDGAPPDTAFVLALAVARRDPARAMRLATQARDALATLVEHHADRHRLDEVEAWLREHRR